MLNIIRYFTSNQTKVQPYVTFSLLCAIQGQPRITGERKRDFWSGISLSSTDGFRFYLLFTENLWKAIRCHRLTWKARLKSAGAFLICPIISSEVADIV